MTAKPTAGASAYPTLLSPLKVGRRSLRNRVIMGSMHTRLEHLDRPRERQVAFYRERARGGVALIVSGGHAPNEAGRLEPGGPILDREDDLEEHRAIVEAVQAEGAAMLLQILHAGRNAAHPEGVAPSAIASPINRFRPREMTAAEIEQTIEDHVRCATLARAAGYDGVELMGSEGYLINQFTVAHTNRREDGWGGTLAKRLRFPIEIVRRTRERLGPDFLIMYRISALDLVEEGATAGEIDVLARAVEEAGADILNTGVGWHEAQVPTIAYPVPRAAWSFSARRLKEVVSLPVVASNRINTPEVAEALLAEGGLDLVSMARPLLADPDFVAKAAGGRRQEINVCIACNQACLDHIFSRRVATCLVNPKACREIEFPEAPPDRRLRVAVVGSGPAGLSAAVTAAERGHSVDLLEADERLGGQLNIAARIPGKEEFHELLRYFHSRLEATGVQVQRGRRAEAESLAAAGYDRIVVATGVNPRRPEIPGIDHPSVASYLDILTGRVEAGRRVAIIGAGGIGFDTAEMLTSSGSESDPERFLAEWGIDPSLGRPGGLAARRQAEPGREVTILQRSPGKPGARLGKTTGWILRGQLRRRGVRTLSGCSYLAIDDEGLHYSREGERRVLPADTIVICAGQLSNAALSERLSALSVPHDAIGGAKLAAELDALRAIDEGARLAYAM